MGQFVYDFVLEDGTAVKMNKDGSVSMIKSERVDIEKLPADTAKEILKHVCGGTDRA